MLILERPVGQKVAVCGATCPSCGSTNTYKIQVKDGDKVVRTYFECRDCGNVW